MGGRTGVSMGIMDLYLRRRRKAEMARIAPYTSLDPESWYGNGFAVELRSPQAGHIYLETGKHCVLDGHYIFEKETGQIRIGDRVHIGGSTLVSVNGIVIGDDVTIAWDCLIYDHDSHSVRWEERREDTEREYRNLVSGKNAIGDKDWSVVRSAPIRICAKAWIGTGVKILKGVTIGEGAVVGAGSVVTKDVEPWTVVGGNPARVIRRLREETV